MGHSKAVQIFQYYFFMEVANIFMADILTTFVMANNGCENIGDH